MIWSVSNLIDLEYGDSIVPEPSNVFDTQSMSCGLWRFVCRCVCVSLSVCVPPVSQGRGAPRGVPPGD
jgi:hypothetical protein